MDDLKRIHKSFVSLGRDGNHYSTPPRRTPPVKGTGVLLRRSSNGSYLTSLAVKRNSAGRHGFTTKETFPFHQLVE